MGRNTTDILVGLEIELENVIINKTPNYWEPKQDGSLKINGLEFTLPVYYTDVKNALTELFNNINATVSDRCSIHVHLNILNLTQKELYTLIALYIIYERALFNFSGKRENNNYCVPIQDLIPTDIFKNLEYTKNWLTKYTAIHLFAENKEYTYLGTLEFRHLKGTMDIEYINKWVSLIINLYQATQTIKFEKLKKDIFYMRTTSSYFQLTNEIFKENTPLITNYENFQIEIEKSISFLKLLLLTK